MDCIFGDWKFVLCYIDDVAVFSKTREEHIKHTGVVLGRLRDANLKLKKLKAIFSKKRSTTWVTWCLKMVLYQIGKKS